MKKVFIALVAIIIAGCDSGGSSSGSSADVTDSNSSSPEEIGAKYAGTYSGTLEATYTASGLGLSESRSEPIRIVIESNGDATIFIDGRDYAGSLDTDRIVAVINVDETYDDISCDGRVSVEANLSTSSINGSASGIGECTDGTITTPVRVAGRLNATRQ